MKMLWFFALLFEVEVLRLSIEGIRETNKALFSFQFREIFGLGVFRCKRRFYWRLENKLFAVPWNVLHCN